MFIHPRYYEFFILLFQFGKPVNKQLHIFLGEVDKQPPTQGMGDFGGGPIVHPERGITYTESSKMREPPEECNESTPRDRNLGEAQ